MAKTACLAALVHPLLAQQSWHCKVTEDLGCYDHHNHSHFLPTPVSGGDNLMSRTYCASIAKDSGFGSTAFCGVEYGNQCWCAQALSPDAKKLDDSKCDMPCAADSMENCGGSYAVGVFRAVCDVGPPSSCDSVQQNVELSGKNEQGLDNPSLDPHVCCAACDKMEACVGWTLNAQQRKCWLKSDVTASHRDGVMSGRKTPGPSPPTPPPSPSTLVPVAVEVDLDATPVPFQHYWKKSFGSGHAALTLRQDFQTQLKQAVEDLGLGGIRYHGIFDDDMRVVVGHRQYNFTLVDASWDSQLSLGLRPIVELSFMPCILAGCNWNGLNPGTPACSSTMMHYKGITMEPTDYEDWYDLVRALVSHAVERYSLDEVLQWHFEVWNEVWGMPFPETYMRLYNASALAVKSVHAELRVGGPATAQLTETCGGVAHFVQEAMSRGLPFDFVSTHFYPSHTPCGRGANWEPNCMIEQMRKTRSLIPAEVPLYLTEYNVGCCLPYDHHDNSGAAAFAFGVVGPLENITDVLSWWTFSDVFEEGGFPRKEFSGTYGAMTVHGVPKPAWRAFELLHKHGGPLRLPVVVQGQDANSGAVDLISALATVPAPGAAPSLFLGFWEHGGPAEYRFNRSVTVRAPGGDRPLTRVTAYRIDVDHANPLKAWQDLGSPTSLTDAQLQLLMDASAVSPEELELQDGEVTINMPPNSAVALVFDRAAIV